MGMAAVIYKKGAPDNFVWEEIKVGSPERGQVRLRSTAVGVNFADTYHRAGIPHPMIVGDPPVVLGFEGVGEIEELGPDVTGFSVGERVCTCLPPLGAYSQERVYPADKLIKVPKDLPLDDGSTGRTDPEGDDRAISPASNVQGATGRSCSDPCGCWRHGPHALSLGAASRSHCHRYR